MGGKDEPAEQCTQNWLPSTAHCTGVHSLPLISPQGCCIFELIWLFCKIEDNYNKRKCLPLGRH